MQKAFLSKTILLVLLTISIISTACNSTNDNITVKINLKNSLSKYHRAYVDVQNDDQDELEDRKRGTDVTFINLEISEALKVIGIKPNSSKNNADLGVSCRFRYGWGLPRIIRHFKIKFRYVTKVKISLVDISTQEIIGEVEYERPFLKKNPKGFIQIMFQKLIDPG